MDGPRKTRRKKQSEAPSLSDFDPDKSSFVPLRSCIPVDHDPLDGFRIEDSTLLDPRSSVDSDSSLSYPSNEPSLLEQLREGLAQGRDAHRKLLMGRNRSTNLTINFSLTSSPGSANSSVVNLSLQPVKRPPRLAKKNRNDVTIKFPLDDSESSVDNQENESPVLPKSKDVFKRPKAKKMSVPVEDVTDSDSSRANDDSLPILDSRSRTAVLSSNKRLRSCAEKDMTIDFSVDSFNSSDKSVTQTCANGENIAASDAPRDLQNNEQTIAVDNEGKTRSEDVLEAPLDPSSNRPEPLNDDHTFVVYENPAGTRELVTEPLSSSATQNSAPVDANFTLNGGAIEQSSVSTSALQGSSQDLKVNDSGNTSMVLPAAVNPLAVRSLRRTKMSIPFKTGDETSVHGASNVEVSDELVASEVDNKGSEDANINSEKSNSQSSKIHERDTTAESPVLPKAKDVFKRSKTKKMSVRIESVPDSDSSRANDDSLPILDSKSQPALLSSTKRLRRMTIDFAVDSFDSSNKSQTSANGGSVEARESDEHIEGSVTSCVLSDAPRDMRNNDHTISVDSEGTATPEVMLEAPLDPSSNKPEPLNDHTFFVDENPAGTQELVTKSLSRSVTQNAVPVDATFTLNGGALVQHSSVNASTLHDSPRDLKVNDSRYNTSVLPPDTVNRLAERSLRSTKMCMPIQVGDETSVNGASNVGVSDDLVASEVDNNNDSEDINVNSEESNSQSSKIHEPDTTTDVSPAVDALSLECSMDDMRRSTNDYSYDPVKISERPRENTKPSERISLAICDSSGLHLSLDESLQYSNISSSNISIAEAVSMEATEIGSISEGSSDITVPSRSSMPQSIQETQVHADADSNTISNDPVVHIVQQHPVLRRSKRSKNITADAGSLVAEEVSSGSLKKPYKNPLMKKSGPKKMSIAFTMTDETIDSSNVTPELHLAIDSTEDEQQEAAPQKDKTSEVERNGGIGETSQTAENGVANKSRRCSKNVTAVEDSSTAKGSNVSSRVHQRVVALASVGNHKTPEDDLQKDDKLGVDSSSKIEAGSTSYTAPNTVKIETESQSDKKSKCSPLTSKSPSTLRRSKRGTRNMSVNEQDAQNADLANPPTVSSGDKSSDKAGTNPEVEPGTDNTCGAGAESCKEPSKNKSVAVVIADSHAVPSSLPSPIHVPNPQLLNISESGPNPVIAEPGITTSCEPADDNIVPAPYAFCDSKAASGHLTNSQSAKASSLQLHVTTMNTENDMGIKSLTSPTQPVSQPEESAQNITVVSTGAKISSLCGDQNHPTTSETAGEQVIQPHEPEPVEDIPASIIPIVHGQIPNNEGILNPHASSSKAETETVVHLVPAQAETLLNLNSQSKPLETRGDLRITRKSKRKSVSFKPPTENVYHSPPDHSAFEDDDQKATDGKTLLENGYEFSKIQMTVDISDIQSSPGNKKAKRHYSSTPMAKRKRIISPIRNVENGDHQFLIPPAAPTYKPVSIQPLPEIISPLNIVPEVPSPVDDKGQTSSQSGKSLDLSCENSLEISAIPKDTTGPKWGNVFHSTPLHRTKAGLRKQKKLTEPPVEPLSEDVPAMEKAPVSEEQAKTVNHSVQTSRNLRSRSKTSLSDASNGSSLSASSKQSLPQSASRNRSSNAFEALTPGGNESAGSPADRISIQDNTVVSTRVESHSRTRGSKSRSTMGSGFKSYDSTRKMTSRRLFNDNGNDDGKEPSTDPSNESSPPKSNATSASFEGDRLFNAPEATIPRMEQLSLPQTDENVSLTLGQNLDDSDSESVVSSGSCASTESQINVPSHVVMRQSFESEVASLRKRPEHRREEKVDLHRREKAPRPRSKHAIDLPKGLMFPPEVPAKKRKRTSAPRLFNPGPKWKKSKHLYAWLKEKLQPKYKLYTNLLSERLVIELNNALTLVRQGYVRSSLDKSIEMLQDLGLCSTQIQLWSFFMKFMPFEFVQTMVPMGGAFGELPGRTAFLPFDLI